MTIEQVQAAIVLGTGVTAVVLFLIAFVWVRTLIKFSHVVDDMQEWFTRHNHHDKQHLQNLMEGAPQKSQVFKGAYKGKPMYGASDD